MEESKNQIRFFETYAEVELTRGFSTKIDLDDVERIKPIRWYAYKGHKEKRWYARSKHFTMQRFLMGFPKDFVVDHRDTDTMDNRKANLRVCTIEENIRNQPLRRTNTSGQKGVYWNKNIKKWHAQIYYEKKKRHLGFFENIEDAKAAYDRRAKEICRSFFNKG